MSNWLTEDRPDRVSFVGLLDEWDDLSWEDRARCGSRNGSVDDPAVFAGAGRPDEATAPPPVRFDHDRLGRRWSPPRHGAR